MFNFQGLFAFSKCSFFRENTIFSLLLEDIDVHLWDQLLGRLSGRSLEYKFETSLTTKKNPVTLIAFSMLSLAPPGCAFSVCFVSFVLEASFRHPITVASYPGWRVETSPGSDQAGSQ
jgi:hypothetical protein